MRERFKVFLVNPFLFAAIIWLMGCQPQEGLITNGLELAFTVPNNNLPVPAADQTASGTEDSSLSFTINAGTDEDGDSLSYFLVALPSGAVLSDCMDQAGSESPDDLTCTYVPSPNATGVTAESLTYKLHDGLEYSSVVGTITFNLTALSDNPVITLPTNYVFPLDGSFQAISQGQALSFTALYSDPDGDAIQAGSYTCVYESVGLDSNDPNYAATGTNCSTLPSLATVNSVITLGTLASAQSDAQFNTSTGAFAWRPAVSQRGTFKFTFGATDSTTQSGSSSMYVSLRDAVDFDDELFALDALFSTDHSALPSIAATARLDGTASDDLDSWIDLTSSTAISLSAHSAAPWQGTGQANTATLLPYSLNFNGTSDKLDLGTPLEDISASSMMISMWIRPTNATGDNDTIVSSSTDPGNGFVIKQGGYGRDTLSFVVGTPNTTAYAAAVQALDPVAFWRFDDGGATAVNSASGVSTCGATCNGTYTNGVVLGQSAAPNASDGSSVDFDGDNDYIELGNIGIGHPLMMNGSTVTVAFWFYQRSGGDTYQRIIDKSSGAGVIDGWAIYIDPTLRTVTFNVNNSVMSIISTENAYEFNTWNHVVITLSETNRTKGDLYINGRHDPKAIAYFDSIGAIPNTAANMRIGTWNHSTAREFNGKLDELAIFNKSLTAGQVQSLYQAGIGCQSYHVLTNNQWTHITAIHAGTTSRLYINGFKECEINVGRTLASGSTHLTLGADAAGTQYWAGSISQLSVSGRSDGADVWSEAELNIGIESQKYRYSKVHDGDIPTENIIFHFDPVYAGFGYKTQTLLPICQETPFLDISSNASSGAFYGSGIAACDNAHGPVIIEPYDSANPSRVNFDGSNDYLVFENKTDFERGQTGSLTISSWIKPNSGLSTANTRIVDHKGLGVWGVYQGYQLVIIEEPGLTGWQVGTGTGVGDASGNSLSVGSNGPIHDHTNWHHLAMSYNATANTLDVYVDGTLERSASGVDVGDLTNGYDLVIGSARYSSGVMYTQGTSGQTYKGDIGPVLIYSEAFSQEKIRQICHAQKFRFSGAACAGP